MWNYDHDILPPALKLHFRRTNLVHNYSNRAASTGCLHYNKVNTTKYGINSFKYQGVKILNDLQMINIYQNNASKIQFLKELKSKRLSNYSLIVQVVCFFLIYFFIHFVLIKFVLLFPPYHVATSVLIVCAKNVLRYLNNYSTEMHFTCRWSLKISF